MIEQRPPVPKGPLGNPVETWRCWRCNRILAKGRFSAGSYVQIKCHSCGEMSERATL